MNIGISRREQGSEVCELPSERIQIFSEFTINVGAQGILQERGGRPWGGLGRPGGVAPAEASRGTPRNEDEIGGGGAAAANRKMSFLRLFVERRRK